MDAANKKLTNETSNANDNADSKSNEDSVMTLEVKNNNASNAEEANDINFNEFDNDFNDDIDDDEDIDEDLLSLDSYYSGKFPKTLYSHNDFC